MSLYTRMRRIYRLIRNRHTYFAYEKHYKENECDKIAPLGHYESPYPSKEELQSAYAKGINENLYGIDCNEKAQLTLFEKIKTFYENCPFADKEKNKNHRFYDFNDNIWFGRDDARSLYAILMHFKPKNIIEIGSGFSTALMLDVNENLNYIMNISCIEPRAERLKNLLRKKDKLQIIEQNLQNLPLQNFSSLGGGGYAFY